MKRLIVPDIHHKIARADAILATEPDAGEVYFLGDYQDDFGDTPALAAATAEWMRRQIEAGRRLLWGNHDLPYAFLPGQHRCPGYTVEKAKAVDRILTADHWRKLRLWHIIPDAERPWILSHAGLDRAWFPNNVADPVAFLTALEEEVLDGLYRHGRSHPLLHFCAASRGGRDAYPGVLWMDWGDFRPIEGLNQIVGHTPLRRPDEYSNERSTNWCLDTHLLHYGILNDQGELSVHRAPGNTATT